MPQSQRTRARKFEANSRRARVARMQAEARRRERRQRLYLIGGSVTAIVAVIVALVVVKVVGGHANAKKLGETAAPASVTSVVTKLPASKLDKVPVLSSSYIIPPYRETNVPALTSGGKPEIFFNGAEYCPYCAAERWALVVALSRFGTFHNLQMTHSSTKDIYPDTPTFSFYRTSYTSPYFKWVGVEDYTNQVCLLNYCTLQKMTNQQNAIFSKYSIQPYTPYKQNGFPFVDFAGKYIIEGPSYNPAVLHQGDNSTHSTPALSVTTIVADLTKPASLTTNPTGTLIEGTANWITATICAVDGGQPASVCNVPVIKTLMHKLAVEKAR